MNNMELEFAGQPANYLVEARSYIGGRSHQQDFAYVHGAERSLFAVLCDGMGGTLDGGFASATAISAMKECYQNVCAQLSEADAPRFLMQSMNAADERVFHAVKRGAGGTTMVAVYLADDCLYWLSVGDSRLYISRSQEFVQATRDHNYFLRLGEMLERNEISPRVYRQESAKGEALISYIGMGGITLFDLTQTGMAVQPKDRFLLSTDGLFRVVTPEAMQAILDADLPLPEKADQLMGLITGYENQAVLDNTTFIIIEAQ